MEYLSVKDMFKIGVGPSSSHTLGPWIAARQWISSIPANQFLRLYVRLFGSLSLTGKGHSTDIAIFLGLSGYDPETITPDEIDQAIDDINTSRKIKLPTGVIVDFNPELDVVFEKYFLDYHANGMSFHYIDVDGKEYSDTFYSIGGGFISKGEEIFNSSVSNLHPFPIENALDLEKHCTENEKTIYDVVLSNELSYMSKDEMESYLLKIWDVMLDSIYRGCHKGGVLPGGLDVIRRASKMYKKLYDKEDYSDKYSWLAKLRGREFNVSSIFKWVSCFALAVNEENASLGRVVTAPTNGSAGVVPAVLMFYLTHYNSSAGNREIIEFLCVASEIGCIFKKGATISAAMGGCQAEIGVSSAMAAAGLTHVLGGCFRQCIVAAEMAMEHHLGLTCDPVGGLVQIPCIERNSMGAIKAINAAELALDTEPEYVKIPLDKVVATMWATAQDMNRKYKETSEGGLAVDVSAPEC